MQKLDGLPLEKECPGCSTAGLGQADEQGNHAGVWECKNNTCKIEFFVSSEMQFYRTDEKESMGWLWSNILEYYET